MENEVYLGDAVYASFDGWNIWLQTRDGRNQRICLEPEVFANLISYEKLLRNSKPDPSSPSTLDNSTPSV